MPVSPITVPYGQMSTEGSLIEGCTPGQGLWVRKKYYVAWADRFTFANQALGLSGLQGAASGTTGWIRKTPFRYPESPNLFARAVEIEPEGRWHDTPADPTTPIVWDQAVITVSFETPQFGFTMDMDPGQVNSLGLNQDEQQALLWATQELDYGSEYLQIPKKSLYWDSDGAPVGQPVARRIQTITMNISWEYFPYIPMGIIGQYVDRLNLNTFLGCAPGTVLFGGLKTRREFSTDGTVAQKVMISLKYREKSWNTLLRNTNTWDYPTDSASAGGHKLFKYTDFLKLLQFLPNSGDSNTPGT